MDGEDEEVIFENRVLHQALNEMGVENVETEKVLPSKCQEPHNKPNGEMTEVQDETKNHRIPANFLTKSFLSHQEITSIYQGFQRNTMNRLKLSPLLSTDDKCFLESFISDESNRDKTLSKAHRLSLLRSLFKTWGLLAVILGIFYVFITSLYMVIEPTHIPELPDALMIGPFYFFALCLALGLVIIYGLLKFYLYHKIYSKLKEMDCIIKEFEKSAENLSLIQKKCMRRIRESEIAARGFTVASMTSNINSNSPLMTEVDKRCPMFRSSLIDGNLDVVGHLEESYKFLTESVPLVVDFKWLDIKPSQSSTSSSSSGLKGNNLNVLDGAGEEIIPITQLNSSHDLMSIHISAFMRRLVLSFVSENCKDAEINPYLAVSQSVQKCVKCIDTFASDLKKQDSFYRAIYSNSEKTDVLENHKDGKRVKSPLESFYIFVNSLDLHLQAVFRMTRELSGHLEEMVEEQQDKASMNFTPDETGLTISDSDRTEWMEKLKCIKSELDSSKSCYDEALKFLSQRESKASTMATTQPDSSTNPKNSPKADPIHKPVPVIPDADPVIEDQVFEVVTGSGGDEAKATRRKMYSPEEKAQIQQQREDLSRFKQELKAVVDHRAISQRKREEKALARTQGKGSSSTPSETDMSSMGGGDGDDEGGSGSSSTNAQNVQQGTEKSKDEFEPQSPQALCKENILCETSVKLESEVNVISQGSRNDYSGEKVSLLAAKLDSADSDENCVNPSELPWAPLMRKENAEIASTRSGKGQNSSGHSSSLSHQLPYDENWRSSIEKTKARHWEMCEKIIQENKDTGNDYDYDGNLKTSDSATDPAGNHNGAVSNDLDNSSFIDISSEDLLFYPIDTDTNSNANNNNNNGGNHYPVEACALIKQQDSDRASSSCSSNSQVVCPRSVNPEEEGFRDVQGAYVSRHNFTASGGASVLDKALNKIRQQNKDGDGDNDEKVVHPNRKRHQAGRPGGEMNTSQWVNISHVEFVSCNGNQYELYRQKDMNADDIESHPPIPSPDPSSSLNASLALMAAARSKHFNLGVEEYFINDDDDDNDEAGIEDEFCQAISAAKMNENVVSVSDVKTEQREAV